MIAVSIRLTSSAAMRKFSAVSSMSGSASAAYGLPCSSESACANSSRRSSIRSAIAWQTAARSHADTAAYVGCAARDAATARSMSAELASADSAMVSPVTGETIFRTTSLVARTHLPPTKLSSVRTVTAIVAPLFDADRSLRSSRRRLPEGLHFVPRCRFVRLGTRAQHCCKREEDSQVADRRDEADPCRAQRLREPSARQRADPLADPPD